MHDNLSQEIAMIFDCYKDLTPSQGDSLVLFKYLQAGKIFIRQA